MSCLYYFKWSDKNKKIKIKKGTFDIWCIIKWDGQIDEVVFWGAKN